VFALDDVGRLGCFVRVILGFLPVFCFFFQRFGCRVKIVTPLMLDLEIKKLFSLIENN
jgi:hypothetical protein